MNLRLKLSYLHSTRLKCNYQFGKKSRPHDWVAPQRGYTQPDNTTYILQMITNKPLLYILTHHCSYVLDQDLPILKLKTFVICSKYSPETSEKLCLGVRTEGMEHSEMVSASLLKIHSAMCSSLRALPLPEYQSHCIQPASVDMPHFVIVKDCNSWTGGWGSVGCCILCNVCTVYPAQQLPGSL